MRIGDTAQVVNWSISCRSFDHNYKVLDPESLSEIGWDGKKHDTLHSLKGAQA